MYNNGIFYGNVAFVNFYVANTFDKAKFGLNIYKNVFVLPVFRQKNQTAVFPHTKERKYTFKLPGSNCRFCLYP
jgi:hypothetical protein